MYDPDGFAHHDLAVTDAGSLVTFAPGEPTVYFVEDEQIVRSWAAPLVEAHGITYVGPDSAGTGEGLWVADIGFKAKPQRAATVPDREITGGQVLFLSLDGEVLARLETPPIPAYDDPRTYLPTAVAVDEARLGGTGNVWVADGYGRGLIHQFDYSGAYLSTITGKESGAVPFACPHGIAIDRRRGEPELYVADRGNARLQVYGLDGVFRRVVGEGHLSSPSALASFRGWLIVAELRGRIALFDERDRFAGYVGEQRDVELRRGWPNTLDGEGNVLAPREVPAGRFNSPHGLAVSPDGQVHVAEWLLGGRHTTFTLAGRRPPQP